MQDVNNKTGFKHTALKSVVILDHLNEKFWGKGGETGGG